MIYRAVVSPSPFWAQESNSDSVRDVSTKKVAWRPVADQLRCQLAETHHVLKVLDRNVSNTQYFSPLPRDVATTLVPLLKSTGWYKRIFFGFQQRHQSQSSGTEGEILRISLGTSLAVAVAVALRRANQ